MDVQTFISSQLRLPDQAIEILYEKLKTVRQGKFSYRDELANIIVESGKWNSHTSHTDIVNLFLQQNLLTPQGRHIVVQIFRDIRFHENWIKIIEGYQPPAGRAAHTQSAQLEQADMEKILRDATVEVKENIEKAKNEKLQLERKIKEMKQEYAQMVQFADPYAKEPKYKDILNPEHVVKKFTEMKEEVRRQGSRARSSHIDIFMKCHEGAERYKQQKLADAEQAMKDVLEQHLGKDAVREGVKTSTSLETTLLKELNLQDLPPYVKEIKDREGLGSGTEKYLELAWRIVLQRPEMKLVCETHSRTELFEPAQGRVLWPALLVEGGETVLGVCAGSV